MVHTRRNVVIEVNWQREVKIERNVWNDMPIFPIRLNLKIQCDGFREVENFFLFLVNKSCYWDSGD